MVDLPQTANGNLPSSMGWVVSHSGRERGEEDQLVHWCHGAAGVVYLFIRFVFSRLIHGCSRAKRRLYQLTKVGKNVSNAENQKVPYQMWATCSPFCSTFWPLGSS